VEVVKAWENAAGPLSKTLGDMLSDLADEHGAEPVAAAIKEAVKNKGYPNIAYVSAVLRNWASRGGQRTRAAPKPVRLEGGAIMLPVASRGGGDR
jgi:DnaD/phage-associated family protein